MTERDTPAAPTTPRDPCDWEGWTPLCAIHGAPRFAAIKAAADARSTCGYAGNDGSRCGRASGHDGAHNVPEAARSTPAEAAQGAAPLDVERLGEVIYEMGIDDLDLPDAQKLAAHIAIRYEEPR